MDGSFRAFHPSAPQHPLERKRHAIGLKDSFRGLEGRLAELNAKGLIKIDRSPDLNPSHSTTYRKTFYYHIATALIVSYSHTPDARALLWAIEAAVAGAEAGQFSIPTLEAKCLQRAGTAYHHLAFSKPVESTAYEENLEQCYEYNLRAARLMVRKKPRSLMESSYLHAAQAAFLLSQSQGSKEWAIKSHNVAREASSIRSDPRLKFSIAVYGEEIAAYVADHFHDEKYLAHALQWRDYQSYLQKQIIDRGEGPIPAQAPIRAKFAK